MAQALVERDANTITSTNLSTHIFLNKRVFQLDYVPKRILHRDKQINRIESILADFTNDVRPRNILCVGDFGTGKTVVVRSVCSSPPSNCTALYVNCAEENTQSRIIRTILRHLSVPVKPGFPRDHYLQLFKDQMAHQTYVILILDEVDKFVERKDSDFNEFFYTLSRSIDNLVAILLTNRVSFESNLLINLDSRVKDTFRFERVEFGDYNAPELMDMLRDRCQMGLNHATYDKEIIAVMGRISYERGLRARGIIDLARKAAEIAEAKGHSKIEIEDVHQASTELSHESEMEIVQKLPPIHRAILGKILLDSPSSSSVFDWYQKIAPRYGIGQSLTIFHTYLKELETLGLVIKEKKGLGRGKGLEMRLVVPVEIASIVAKSLQNNTPPHPIAEYVNV